MADGAGFGTIHADSAEGVDALWGRVRATLRERVGAGSFQSWIAPLRLASVEEGVATLTVPTAFLGSYVARNFQDAILAALAEAGAPSSRLVFAPQGRVAPQAAAAAPVAPAPAPQAEPAEEAMRLDPRLVFDRFVVGKSNELAYAAARRIAEGNAVGFNPLFLHGGVGLGKTHLMQAIAHEMRARRPQTRVLYLSAEQFMIRFVTALRDRKMMDFKQVFRAVDVLMVDDIQFIAGKDSTQEEFFHTFNALVDQGKQIVLTADRSPVEIAALEERVTSRLQSGLVVQVNPADYELRLGVLQSKVAAARAADPSLRIADGVLDFLAARVTSNLRVLEGALTRLCAQASLVGREITLDLARDCLGDVLRASDRKVSIEEIQRRVAEHYHIRLADLIGPKRLRSFARPRQVAMYLSKTMTSRSLPDIGRRFGGRDHTTIMHGVRKIEELLGTDSQIADDLDLLKRALES
ncbi:chromosomal replication initiator protein DnaA [Rubellimicrobium aerolatum]|uniref:Chromosomal replication initiator protein DnaA n=1 Tax=Rubellimicrobium aerolatum TaxID=490979 RepID=A0ABW0S9U7_9RHOB|nr:chromosomal replication initiator protein DnaA [Rubellimicrobium aerolatum]MBP1805051.1 chromosomal replication initiator protein [Rubellimicrobium aerolatum]